MIDVVAVSGPSRPGTEIAVCVASGVCHEMPEMPGAFLDVVKAEA